MYRISLSLAVAMIGMNNVAAQPAAEGELPGDAMMARYLAGRAAEVEKGFLNGAKTRQDWEKQASRLRQEYLDMLGLWPLPERTPLRPTVTGTVRRGDVAIEKVHFQSKPGLYVTGNLYRPVRVEGKLPAVLYVCGHSGRGRDGNKTAFQDHGMWFASNGYVCLVVDTLQLGEVAGKHHGTYNLGRFWWQARGYTPAGVECWNGVRAIDYLVSRPDVDPERIGVTGISGGGAATVWISAADDRVKVAVPVSGMSDLESYVAHKVINGHCDCMFLVNTYGWAWATIAARIAPRPLLFANSDNDSIFPMDGNRRVFARLREVYRLYGAEDHLAEHVSRGGHAYRPDLRLAVFRFINRHLKNDTGPVRDADFKELPGMELRVFPEDTDLPADSINGQVDETFVAREAPRRPETGGFATWKEGLWKGLRERCFRNAPDRFPAAEPDGDSVGVVQPLAAEPGVRCHIISVVAVRPGVTRGTLLVLNADEEILPATQGWAKPFVDERVVYAVLPRGGVPGRWTRKNPPNYVERAHALLGSTVDAGRVRDVAATARMFDERFQGKVSWRVVGRGQAGVLAAYAALFEPSIGEAVVVDPPASHRDGPTFLNVLRVLDVPDALGMLAPRPLTLVNAGDKAFERVADIYRAAGAADKYTRR